MVDELPEGTLQVFPVQYFSQRELSDTSNIRESRTNPGADISRLEGIFLPDTFDGSRSAGLRHNAIDIMAPVGNPVFAAVSGRVPDFWTLVKNGHRVSRPGVGTEAHPRHNSGGNYVIIIDDFGRYHYYAHLNAVPQVSIGERIEAGRLLGHVGHTGIATRNRPHLHYQVTTRTAVRASVYWNPYKELVRLIEPLGGRPNPSGYGIVLTYDNFYSAVQGRLGSGITDPWSGRVHPALVSPWHIGF